MRAILIFVILGVIAFSGCTRFGMATGKCNSTAPMIRIDVRNTERFDAIDVGPDRIYFEQGVSREAADAMATLLSQARPSLLQTTGVTPPPRNLALLLGDPDNFETPPDREGRHVHALRARDYRKPEETIGVVVHEWTHEIVDAVHGRADNDARYLEDGLCDLVASLVEEAVRREAPSSVLCSRAKELTAGVATHPPVADLVHLAKEMDVQGRPFENMESVAKRFCSLDEAWGYALGLAYWIDRLRERPDIVRLYLRQARNMDSRAGERFSWLDRAAPGQLVSQSLIIAKAIDVLTSEGATKDACALLQSR